MEHDDLKNQVNEVRKAMYKKAVGFEYEETEVTASKDGKTTRVKKSKRYLPPDTTAALLFLRLSSRNNNMK